MPKTIVKVTIIINDTRQTPSEDEVAGWVSQAYLAARDAKHTAGGKVQISREWQAEEE